ncbi:hypothetical protein Rhopal_005392-T1 [Rhodotorula paludigena]|uniref:FCP1 homology domain-containing protein n=1 Tax=Rhodotorula paludigena TaxID=86838 RepID=A0AAV5GTK2_9BASI|nr:hypothetical protein Rhopal_005392-T1 [Rhodotorula paludigena]
MQPPPIASPGAQADEPVASTSTADTTASTTTSDLPPPLESPNSPNPGAKPARPPKAAQRPSTASIRQDDDTSDGSTFDAQPAGSAAAVSSVETVDDAAAKDDAPGPDAPVNSSTASATTAAAPPASDGAAPAAADTPERSSTAAQSVSAQTGESSTIASKGAPASTSTSLPSPAATTATAPPSAAANNTASEPTPAPAASSPAPAPASSSTPRSTQPQAQQKKKRKGPFSFLLACIPCVSSTGHDDTAPGAGLQKRPSTSARLLEKEQEKRQQAAANDKTSSSAATADEKDAAAATPAAAPVAPVEPESAITPNPTEPLAAVAAATAAAGSSPSATAAGTLTAPPPPPPTSSPSQRGVVLPPEETEGVTSGAVVPPGQAALVQQQQLPQQPEQPAAPAKQRRRKSGKHPKGASATDGIITSVPEPGALGGGIHLAVPGETTSDEDESDEDEDEDEEDEDEEEEEDEEQGLIARGGVGIPIGEDGLPHPLLDELSEDLKGRKCLVLDLDETLVHSSFKMVHQADYVVPVEIENQFHNVYVIKRPGVDTFLKAMGDIYEVVVFTASLSKYADPVLDQLDVHRVVKHRLFRESCYNNKGNYVKDLSQLGRPISECIIIDNSPASYVFHPNNAVPISSWFNDPHDTELTDLVPFLADLGTVDDVRSVLDANLYPPHAALDQQPEAGFQSLQV